MSKHSVLRNVFTVGAFTMLSRVLGLLREMLQSRLIGAGVEQSAFTLAFAIPNMARKLFGEGALTAAFVPLFRESLEQDGHAEAARLARAVMTTILLVLAAVVVAVVLGLFSVEVWAVRHGWSYRARLILTLVMTLTPYMLAICGAAFGMGVVNALGRFRASSFMPALLNLVWIASLVLLLFVPGASPRARILFVSGAILFGGYLQMAFMFRCMARAGISPKPLFSGWRTSRVKRVWHQLGLGALGAGATQVNYMLDQALAQLAAPWAAAVVGYAERLMDLPLGVIGVAFGTVLLPAFSGFFAKRDLEGARTAFGDAFRNMMFLMLPAAAGLFLLAPEVTTVIYEGGSFDAVASLRVSRALAVYALGLAFFGFNKILVPWFQAQGDMKTPLRVTVLTVCLNAVLNILAVVLLPVEWRHVGLATSTVLCAFAGVVILAVLARRRNGPLGVARVLPALGKMVIGVAVLSAVLVALKPICAAHNRYWALVELIAAGAASYGLVVLVALRREALAALRRRRALVLLPLALLAAPAASAALTFDAGADLRIRQELMENVPGLPGTLQPDGTRTGAGMLSPVVRNKFTNHMRFRPRVWGELKANENWRLYLRLTDEFRWCPEPYRNAHTFPDELIIDNLYLEGKSLWNGLVDVTVGRQDIYALYGLDHVFIDGTPGDGSRTVYADMARTAIHFTEQEQLDLFFLYNADWNPLAWGTKRSGFSNTGYGSSADREMDDWGWGGVWSGRIGRALPYQIFALQKQVRGYHVQGVKHPGQHRETFGLKLVPELDEAWSLQLEGMGQVGRNDDGDWLSGWSTYSGINWKSPRAGWKPFGKIGFHTMSGDKNAGTEDGGHHAWDPIWARGVNDSEMFLYGTHYGAGWWSNMLYTKLTLGVEFAKRHRLTGSAGPMFAAVTDGMGGGSGSFKGFLSQARYDFPLYSWQVTDARAFEIFGHFVAEFFNPGDYFETSKPAWFVRWQIDFKF